MTAIEMQQTRYSTIPSSLGYRWPNRVLRSRKMHMNSAMTMIRMRKKTLKSS